MNNENLIRMANDISNFFQSDPDRSLAVQGIADHLRKFWEPRMRKQIVIHYGNGGSGLNDLAKEAVGQLASEYASLTQVGDG